MKSSLTHLKEKSEKELTDLLHESREKIRALRFGVRAKETSKVRDLRKTKRLVAQILTLVRARPPKAK